MTGLLEWVDAQPEHRGQLMSFTCTRARRSRRSDWRRHTPQWWEYEVQSAIRDARLPLPRSDVLRLGFQGAALGAVYWYEELDGPAQVEVLIAALSTQLRGKGGGYADEMFEDALDQITERAIRAEIPLVEVSGQIWEENHPSQSLCRRHGFRHTGMACEGVQRWSAALLV